MKQSKTTARLLSMLLMLCMVLTLFPASAFAALPLVEGVSLHLDTSTLDMYGTWTAMEGALGYAYDLYSDNVSIYHGTTTGTTTVNLRDGVSEGSELMLAVTAYSDNTTAMSEATYSSVVTAYGVTYNFNGHDKDQTVAVLKGEPAADPGKLTDKGWSFTGWYADAGCTTLWDFTTPITGTTILYAGWQEEVFDLTVTLPELKDGDTPAEIREKIEVTPTVLTANTINLFDENFNTNSSSVYAKGQTAWIGLTIRTYEEPDSITLNDDEDPLPVYYTEKDFEEAVRNGETCAYYNANSTSVRVLANIYEVDLDVAVTTPEMTENMTSAEIGAQVTLSPAGVQQIGTVIYDTENNTGTRYVKGTAKWLGIEIDTGKSMPDTVTLNGSALPVYTTEDEKTAAMQGTASFALYVNDKLDVFSYIYEERFDVAVSHSAVTEGMQASAVKAACAVSPMGLSVDSAAFLDASYQDSAAYVKGTSRFLRLRIRTYDQPDSVTVNGVEYPLVSTENEVMDLLDQQQPCALFAGGYVTLLECVGQDRFDLVVDMPALTDRMTGTQILSQVTVAPAQVSADSVRLYDAGMNEGTTYIKGTTKWLEIDISAAVKPDSVTLNGSSAAVYENWDDLKANALDNDQPGALYEAANGRIRVLAEVSEARFDVTVTRTALTKGITAESVKDSVTADPNGVTVNSAAFYDKYDQSRPAYVEGLCSWLVLDVRTYSLPDGVSVNGAAVPIVTTDAETDAAAQNQQTHAFYSNGVLSIREYILTGQLVMEVTRPVLTDNMTTADIKAGTTVTPGRPVYSVNNILTYKEVMDPAPGKVYQKGTTLYLGYDIQTYGIVPDKLLLNGTEIPVTGDMDVSGTYSAAGQSHGLTDGDVMYLVDFVMEKRLDVTIDHAAVTEGMTGAQIKDSTTVSPTESSADTPVTFSSVSTCDAAGNATAAYEKGTAKWVVFTFTTNHVRPDTVTLNQTSIPVCSTKDEADQAAAGEASYAYFDGTTLLVSEYVYEAKYDVAVTRPAALTDGMTTEEIKTNVTVAPADFTLTAFILRDSTASNTVTAYVKGETAWLDYTISTGGKQPDTLTINGTEIPVYASDKDMQKAVAGRQSCAVSGNGILRIFEYVYDASVDLVITSPTALTDGTAAADIFAQITTAPAGMTFTDAKLANEALQQETVFRTETSAWIDLTYSVAAMPTSVTINGKAVQLVDGSAISSMGDLAPYLLNAASFAVYSSGANMLRVFIYVLQPGTGPAVVITAPAAIAEGTQPIEAAQQLTVSPDSVTGSSAEFFNETAADAAYTPDSTRWFVVGLNVATRPASVTLNGTQLTVVASADLAQAKLKETDSFAVYLPASSVLFLYQYVYKAATRYTVDLTDGGTDAAGAGSYAAGTTVTIDAGTRTGYSFKEWTSADVSFADAESANTTFFMPAQNVTVTATWTKDQYQVTVNDAAGTAGAGAYAAGETVTISAGTKEGYDFTGWTSSDGVVFTDAASADTTFVMPAQDVTVTATWAKTPYEVTITGAPNAAGAGTYTSGDTVTISAGTNPGYTFAGWTGTGVTFADASSPDTSFVMPAQSVTVTASWTETAFTVTVNDGVPAAGSYKAGETVAISAGTKDGYEFVNWTGTGVTFADARSADTTFVMPAQDVTVTAVWAKSPYEVTITGAPNATGAGKYVVNDTVLISAGTNPGYTFVNWTGSDGVVFASETSPDTSFLMPEKNVTVTANWVETTYTVTVDGGASGTGIYKAGETVTVSAGIRDGYEFTGWTGTDGVTFANSAAADTTFVMPEKNVTVTANWQAYAPVPGDDDLMELLIPVQFNVQLGGNLIPGDTRITFKISPLTNADADLSSLMISGNVITVNKAESYSTTIRIVGTPRVLYGAGGLRISVEQMENAFWKTDNTQYAVLIPSRPAPSPVRASNPAGTEVKLAKVSSGGIAGPAILRSNVLTNTIQAIRTRGETMLLTSASIPRVQPIILKIGDETDGQGNLKRLQAISFINNIYTRNGAVNTGDSSKPVLWEMLLCLSLLGAAGTAVICTKKRKQN